MTVGQLDLTLGLVPPAVSLPVLAAWECVIGTLTPIVLVPGELFTRIPYAPTLEGQYIMPESPSAPPCVAAA